MYFVKFKAFLENTLPFMAIKIMVDKESPVYKHNSGHYYRE